MVLKKTARGVQMDREAILKGTAEPPARAAAAPAADATVLDLRQDHDEEPAPVTVPAAAGTTDRAAQEPGPPAPKPAARRTGKPKPAPAVAAGVGLSYTVQLTEEQWAWVESEAARRGIAQRYVLLSAVEAHRQAIVDHFRTAVQEGVKLFRWTGEPKDVEGRKIAKSLRFPPPEREILQGLIEEAGAPSMAIYLRIAADIEMRAQGKA